MVKNIGKVDKIIRILISIIANVLFVTRTFDETISKAILALGGYCLVTAILGFSIIYKFLKISTKK